MNTLILRLSAFALAGVLSLAWAYAQDRSLAAPAPDGLRKGGTLHESQQAPPSLVTPGTCNGKCATTPSSHR